MNSHFCQSVANFICKFFSFVPVCTLGLIRGVNFFQYVSRFFTSILDIENLKSWVWHPQRKVPQVFMGANGELLACIIFWNFNGINLVNFQIYNLTQKQEKLTLLSDNPHRVGRGPLFPLLLHFTNTFLSFAANEKLDLQTYWAPQNLGKIKENNIFAQPGDFQHNGHG